MTTKSQLVSTVSEKLGLSKRAAARIVAVVSDVILTDLVSTGTALVPGLGKVVKVARPARSGRNPRTGEALQIAAKSVVRFKPAATAKRAVNA